MLSRVLRTIGLTLIILIVAGTAGYFAGVRISLDGGGTPHLRFAKSAQSRADEIARHRESQRAQPQAPSVSEAPASSAAAPIAAGAPAAIPATTTKADPSSPSSEWTDFRGPRRDGRYEGPIATDWPSDGLKPLWKQPVGGGYASFVGSNLRAYTIEQRGDDEVVAAYDVRTGRELWANRWPAAFRESMGGDGPRATPTLHDGTVYALGGAGELRAIDASSGQSRWRTNILDDASATNLQWGMSAAPLIVDETVIVLPGGAKGNSIVAYDRRSGKKAWGALDDRQAYASPMLVTLAGVRQVIVFTASRLVGITPERGELLWEFPWKTQYDVNASQPLLIGDRIFISTGYGTGAAMIEIAREGTAFRVRELWRTNRMKNQFTSSVHHDGLICGLDEAILACLSADDGKLLWKGGRYGYGQVMLAGDHLVVITESGELVLVKADPKAHVELAKFQAIDGKTWNHPAVVDGVLLVRNADEMAGFKIR